MYCHADLLPLSMHRATYLETPMDWGSSVHVPLHTVLTVRDASFCWKRCQELFLAL